MKDKDQQFPKIKIKQYPLQHRRLLKRIVLASLHTNQNKSRASSAWNVINNIFSMLSIKKFIAVGMVVVFGVAIIVGAGSLLFKLGVIGQNQDVVSAHELLRLTREQAQSLSPDEKKELTKNIQGDLEDIWNEAEAAEDLEFLTGRKYWEQYFKDMNRYISPNNPIEINIDEVVSQMEKMNQRESAFRFTDSQGKVTYLSIHSGNTGNLDNNPNKVLLPHTVLMVVKYSEKEKPVSLGDEQACEKIDTKILQDFITERIKQKFPNVWNNLQNGSKIEFELHNPEEEMKMFNDYTQYLQADKDLQNMDMLMSDESLRIDTAEPAGYALVLKFLGQDGKKYYAVQLIKCEDYTQKFAPLMIHKQK